MRRTALYARAAWCLIFAVIHELIFYTTVFPLGLLLVPVAIWKRRRAISVYGHDIETAPRWLWLWGNDEDGFEPVWYKIVNPTWNRYVRMWVWAAWRNPVNNLRFITWIYKPPVFGQVHAESMHGWFIIWQDWRHRLVRHDWKYTCGFKYQPEDVLVPCKDWRRWGVGFGIRKT